MIYPVAFQPLEKKYPCLATDSEEYAEQDFWIESVECYGRDIVIVAMEHEEENADSREMSENREDWNVGRVWSAESTVESRSQAGGKIPQDWRSVIADQVDGASCIMQEYAPWYIWSRSQSDPGFFRREIDDYMLLHFEDFFMEVACQAWIKGIPVLYSDIADRPSWRLMDDFDRIYTGMRYLVDDRLNGFEYRGLDRPIHPMEFEMGTATDARRLIWAVSLLCEAQRQEPGSKLVCVLPPAHALRVLEYLRRDTDGLSRFVDGIKFGRYAGRLLIHPVTREFTTTMSLGELNAARWVRRFCQDLRACLDIPRSFSTRQGFLEEAERSMSRVAEAFDEIGLNNSPSVCDCGSISGVPSRGLSRDDLLLEWKSACSWAEKVVLRPRSDTWSHCVAQGKDPLYLRRRFSGIARVLEGWDSCQMACRPIVQPDLYPGN